MADDAGQTDAEPLGKRSRPTVELLDQSGASELFRAKNDVSIYRRKNFLAARSGAEMGFVFEHEIRPARAQIRRRV